MFCIFLNIFSRKPLLLLSLIFRFIRNGKYCTIEHDNEFITLGKITNSDNRYGKNSRKDLTSIDGALVTTAIPRAATAAETGYTTHYQSNYYSCDDYHGNDDAESVKKYYVYIQNIAYYFPCKPLIFSKMTNYIIFLYYFSSYVNDLRN